MASILAFNLTQTAGHAPRKMNSPDLSTKLKLMGVDVASFGDYFAHERMLQEAERVEREKGVAVHRKRPRDTRADPLKSLTYRDPISATYRNFVFTSDGAHLVGGIVRPLCLTLVLVRVLSPLTSDFFLPRPATRPLAHSRFCSVSICR